MFRLKIPAEYDELDENQQETESNGELSQCKRKIKAEYIRDRRNRGGPQIRFCDQTDAQ